MSDKKRRDITLGEMQDECKKRSGLCSDGMPTQCQYSKICDSMLKRIETENGDYAHNEWRSPIDWNLTDPPRFNEAQMALLSGMYAAGIKYLNVAIRTDGKVDALNARKESVMRFEKELIGITDGTPRTLDLAELLGKDAT